MPFYKLIPPFTLTAGKSLSLFSVNAIDLHFLIVQDFKDALLFVSERTFALTAYRNESYNLVATRLVGYLSSHLQRALVE